MLSKLPGKENLKQLNMLNVFMTGQIGSQIQVLPCT